MPCPALHRSQHGAVVLPISATLQAALLVSAPAVCSRQRHSDFQNSMEGWAEFVDEMKQYYGVDVGCLSGWEPGMATQHRQSQGWRQGASAGAFCRMGRPASVTSWALQNREGAAPRKCCGTGASPALPSPPPPCVPPLAPPPAEDYRKEQLDYFSYTAAWTDIHPSQVRRRPPPPAAVRLSSFHANSHKPRACRPPQHACFPVAACRWWAPLPASSRTTCTPSRWRSSRRHSRWA